MNGKMKLKVSNPIRMDLVVMDLSIFISELQDYIRLHYIGHPIGGIWRFVYLSITEINC